MNNNIAKKELALKALEAAENFHKTCVDRTAADCIVEYKDSVNRLEQLIGDIADEIELGDFLALANKFQGMCDLCMGIQKNYGKCLLTKSELDEKAACKTCLPDMRIYADDFLKQDAKSLIENYKDMIDAIVSVINEKGLCSKKDLKARGFSAKEIKNKWPLAYALANAKLLKGK